MKGESHSNENENKIVLHVCVGAIMMIKIFPQYDI